MKKLILSNVLFLIVCSTSFADSGNNASGLVAKTSSLTCHIEESVDAGASVNTLVGKPDPTLGTNFLKIPTFESTALQGSQVDATLTTDVYGSHQLVISIKSANGDEITSKGTNSAELGQTHGSSGISVNCTTAN